MPSLIEPDAPTIQDIKDLIRDQIVKIQADIKAVDADLATLKTLKAKHLYEFSVAYAAATKAKDDKEIEKLEKEHDAFGADLEKRRRELASKKAELAAQKKDLEERKAALDLQLAAAGD